MASKTVKKEGGKDKNKSGKGGAVNKPTPKTSTPVAPPPEAPTEKLPIDTRITGSKKWCIKDTSAFHPDIEKWYFKEDEKVQIPVSAPSSYPLKRNTIVDVLPQDISIIWSAISYEETIYDLIDDKTGKKDWVTTRFTGWVDNAHLDDYIEEFPNFEVRIPNATKKSTDLQQNMILEDEAKYNMCGQLCVAFIVKEDIDPNASIDTVLARWREAGIKNKEGININYAKLVGKGRDETLVKDNLKEILDLYYTGDMNKKIEPYKVEVPGKPVKVQKIPLGNATDVYDDRHADVEFQDKLRRYYFITLVTINPNTGELIPNLDPTKRNHWVVVDKVSRNGVRVELYNPSPNKRQAYSFYEFSRSVGSNPNTGWWVERNRPLKADEFKPLKPEVTIEHPTDDQNDAEQYMLVDRLKKTNLCGEFCVSYILTDTLELALERWNDNQEILKRLGHQTAGIWELATILQAYGLNNRQDVTSGNGSHSGSFSIDKALRYWKAVQTDLYNSILGNGNNEPTGLDDLITILKAYGYNNKGDYIYGGLASSLGGSADMLRRYYFIAGVKIDTKKKGRLKNKLGDGVDHWVVVNEINPAGTLVGGNGGWVQLYNPFSNVLEEYSYREFVESFSGVGLWVMRDITPTFTWQYRVPAKDKRKGSEKKVKDAPNKMSQADLLKAIKAKSDKTSLQAFAKALSNKSGWDKDAIVKLMKTPEKVNRKSVAEVERKVCEHFEIDFIPREIGRWLRDTSDGDLAFAVELASALRQFGILVIEGKKGRIVNLENPALPDVIKAIIISHIDSSASVSQLARKVASAFTDQVIEELKKIPPIKIAYKSWADYVKWEKTIAVPHSNLYRVRTWGDNVMGPLGFDVNVVKTSNFQAVGLYNKATGFGAVKNYAHIPREDIDRLIDMQFDEIVDGKKMTVEDKMNWLCQFVGRIYMFDSGKDSWQKSTQIRWGTIALGGNLVQVVGEEEIEVKLPGEENGKAVRRRMMRLAGFRKSDWSRSLDELLALGLVHRCFVANSGNTFADTSRGIVYSPFYSMLDWDFAGTAKPDALYIPFEYLEPKPESKPEPNLDQTLN
jgi:hypothetical protein